MVSSSESHESSLPEYRRKKALLFAELTSLNQGFFLLDFFFFWYRIKTCFLLGWFIFVKLVLSSETCIFQPTIIS